MRSWTTNSLAVGSSTISPLNHCLSPLNHCRSPPLSPRLDQFACLMGRRRCETRSWDAACSIVMIVGRGTRCQSLVAYRSIKCLMGMEEVVVVSQHLDGGGGLLFVSSSSARFFLSRLSVFLFDEKIDASLTFTYHHLPVVSWNSEQRQTNIMSSAFTKTSSQHERTAGVSRVSLCKISLVINKVSLVMNEWTERTIVGAVS